VSLSTCRWIFPVFGIGVWKPPSITQNYLDMIREAHEERDDDTDATV
jgi:hypothetical protein